MPFLIMLAVAGFFIYTAREAHAEESPSEYDPKPGDYLHVAPQVLCLPDLRK